jgi:hypothetical protein
LPIFFGRDINLSVEQTHFNFLNARLASEVLFHPVGSKVSSHALDAHVDVGDLRLGQRHCQHGAKQKKQAEFSDIQDVPP